jgi:hypothetical protein
MLWLARWRAFLGERQIDIESACGLAPGKLGAAETGRLQLNDVEMRVLIDYLGNRLRALVMEYDGNVFVPEPAAGALKIGSSER